MEVNSSLHDPAYLPTWYEPLMLIKQKGSVSPKAGPDALEKRKVSCPLRKLNQESSAIQPTTYSFNVKNLAVT